MSKSILLAGGGTAGHVNPLLAVAEAVREYHADARISVLGTREGLEATLVPERGFDLRYVPRVPMPRRPTPQWFTLPGKLQAAVKAASDAIKEIDADVVVGFGGYVSTPAYLAARKLNVPIVVQEQNARPGIANKLGARWASAVTTTFESTLLDQAHVTGLPLRPEISRLIAARAAQPSAIRTAAAHELGLDPSRPVLVVTGGSLGALRVNMTMTQVAAQLLSTGIQVLHLTGKGKSAQVIEDLKSVPAEDRTDYHVMEYLTRMDLAYAVADLVVCRSGAGTVCELAALGIPAVFVPLPIGNGEQKLNAEPMVSVHSALIVDDAQFTEQWATTHIVPLVTDGARLHDMAQRAQQVGKPQATLDVLKVIESVAKWA
ncbi:undecaprenyldiphospho-muramoylpentapeptide beta-N-acetylglucosaminyltransferase [Timonella sp. A28]|uniref:undecaprenyldiphospho-muramoylpentapeptide beta-N-acetylglucosaminyltransferase n=1 Tax=Timonella sp. A28 TaxID=3442640 RepID=UPI003EB87B29